MIAIEIDLNKKLQNLRSLCKVMIDSDQKKRPNCDKILSAKKEWGLNRSDFIPDLSIDSIMKLFVRVFFETESLENCFIKRFIKVKFNI